MTRAAMTAREARENIKAMTAETPRAAMRRLLLLALGPAGNLSANAREIYAAKLAEM